MSASAYLEVGDDALGVDEGDVDSDSAELPCQEQAWHGMAHHRTRKHDYMG